jgi:hypothetical protein
MAYTHLEIKKFVGLHLQPNTLTVPDGALEVANNIVISEDFVIRKRPGFPTFHTPSSGTLKNLHNFESEIIASYGTKLQHIDSGGTGTDLSGETFSVTGNRVPRSELAKDNFYVTSDNGVMKITSTSSQVTKVGIPPALDLRARFIEQANVAAASMGPIEGDVQVAYRILFGKKDANKNLLLGAPSDIAILANTKVAADYVHSGGGSPYTITVTEAGHGLITGNTITVTDATSSQINGTYTITFISSSQFSFIFTGTAPTNGTLSYEYNRKPRLEFTIPTEIKDATDSTDFFYQIYRTTQSAAATAVPDTNFALLKEAKPTASELANRIVVFDDDIDDIFLLGATPLYTNENSGEGELQENSRPPLCEDIALFKDMMFYLNCTERHLINMQLVSSDVTNSVIGNADYVEVKQDATTRRYVARTGVGNATVTSESASFVSTTITVNYTAHGLVTGDTIFVHSAIGTGTLPAGSYTLASHAANSFTFVAASAPTTLTDLDFEGVTNGTYPIFQLSDSATNLSIGIRDTAIGLVKAINRDTTSPVYARYVSGVDDLPGKFFLESKTFNTNPIQLRAVTAAATTPGSAFSPVLTTSFSDTESDQSVDPNTAAVAKVGEPEAVPRTSRIVIGARNKHGQRIFALRDSVLVLKDDGVFRVDGDRPSNLVATILDNTVVPIAPSTAVLSNNTVVFLADQGVSTATATSVEVISRMGIELPLQAVIGNSNIATASSAVAYESQRLYLLTTIAPQETTATRVYCYNFLTQAWTTWDTLFKQAIVGPNDKLFYISMSNTVKKERKNQNKLDYTDESFAITVNSVTNSGATANITSSLSIPASGDVIVQSNVISRIKLVTSLGAGAYSIQFEQAGNLQTGANTIYKGYTAEIKTAPFHGGLTNREKHFAQFQVHTKDRSISVIEMTFANESFGSSEATTWRLSEVASSSGWGNEPWGFFPWGLEDGINLSYGTQPAPAIRIYVPRFAARGTYIQAILSHTMGAEPMNIQAIGYQLRAYQERVSR